MKNITITVKDEVAGWARIWAARHNTSVSRLLGDLLESRMNEETGYDAAMKRYLRKKPKVLRAGSRERLPRRESLHARDLR